MTTDIVPSDWFDIGPRGVIPRPGVTVPIETWASITTSMLNYARRQPFLLGDMLNFGEATYGEKYAQAIDMTGLSYHTLAQYCSVCKAIPYEERSPDVPYSYYRRIKALPNGERQEWIERAASGDFENGDALKNAIKDHKEPPALTKVLCPACRSQLEDRALERGKCQECGSKAIEWAVLFNRLFDAVTELRTTGDVEPFEQFCTRYNVMED